MTHYQIVFATLLRFIGVALSFLLNVYLSKELDKDVLGTYFIFSQVLLVLCVFSKAGIDIACLKHSNTMSKSNFYLIMVNYINYIIKPLLIFFAVLILTVQYFFSDQLLLIIYCLFISIIPLSIVNIISESLKGLKHQILGTVIQTCFLPVIIFLLLILIGKSIFLTFTLAIIVVMFVAIFASKGIIDRLPKNSLLFNKKVFWNDAKSFTMIALLNVIIASLDVLMLAAISTSSEVAEYGVASKLVAISSVFLVAVNGVLGPKFSEYWNLAKIKEIRILFIKVTLMMFLIALLILLIFYFFSSEILLYVYGKNYLNAEIILKILALGQFIVLATGPVAYLLMMTVGKKYHYRSLIVAVCLNIALNFLLIPLYGAVGAAVATAISLIVKNIYSFVCLSRVIDKKHTITNRVY